MPSLNIDIVVPLLLLGPECKPVKQKLRLMKPKWNIKNKEEIVNKLEAGLLEVTDYPKWIANIVPVPKKDGKVRICIGYRDLNEASPKDDFPLPYIDVLVDNTAGHLLFSFIDGFSGL